MDEFSALGSEALQDLREELRKDYARFQERGLKLDLTRGKPSAEQLDFSNELLELPGAGEVERLAASDARIKGLWFVPKYSNPTGITVSDLYAERLARMATAAADFRIFWDDAYSVHHLTDHHVTVAPIVRLCAEAGNADRV